MDAVGEGFLKHSHCTYQMSIHCKYKLTLTVDIVHSAINGHLAQTGQNASGNRGDDFRALKLCELQPYTFLHPNGETGIPAILGCQGEEKAGGGRGMKTVCVLYKLNFTI